MISNTAIEVKNLSKKFHLWHGKESSLKSTVVNFLRGGGLKREEFWALRNINLGVKRGETLGLVGPNGSGKTTLLKILAGIIYPTKGEVKVNGRASTLFELGTGFHPELTGRENIYLNGTILGLSREKIREKFDEIVEFAELGEFIDMPLKHYSSGMQVRLAFSVAINVDPEILLLDEVLAVGDAAFQSKSFSAFQDFKKRGVTIVFVSHDLEAIKANCDRALFLHRGRIVSAGKPLGVVARYRQRVEGVKTDRRSLVQEAKRFGDGKVRVKEVWIEDDKGKRINVASGVKIHIKVLYKFYEDSRNPIFGITVTNREGRQVFVTNTMWKNIKTGRFKKGEKLVASFNLPNSFEKGYYLISPAVAYADGKRFYDCRIDLLEFFVHKPYSTGGQVNPTHQIYLEKQK